MSPNPVLLKVVSNAIAAQQPLDAFFSRIHPDSRAPVAEAYRAALEAMLADLDMIEGNLLADLAGKGAR